MMTKFNIWQDLFQVIFLRMLYQLRTRKISSTCQINIVSDFRRPIADLKIEKVVSSP